MKERGSSRSFSRQLQAALLSSQSDNYLHQLGVGSSNGVDNSRSEQPIAFSSKIPATIEIQQVKRTTQDLSIEQLLAPSEPSKLNKQEAKSYGKEEPGSVQNAVIPSDDKGDAAEAAAKKYLVKAAKAERDARFRAGAAQYQEILRKGPPKPKPGLLEKIAIIKAEKAARDTEMKDGKDLAIDSVEPDLDYRQRAQGKPSVWSTSLQDLRTADELCPDTDTKKGRVGVKLSRGRIARAVLFADSAAVQNQRLDRQGAAYFDVVVPMSKKRSPIESKQQNKAASNGSLSAADRSGQSLGSEEPIMAPPPRRSFMERRMARGWAYQQMQQDVVMSPSTPQPEPQPDPKAKAMSTIDSIPQESAPRSSGTVPTESSDKQTGYADAMGGHQVPTKAVAVPVQSDGEAQASPATTIAKEARDASTEGLLEAYRLETPVYLYLAGKCQCSGAADAALACIGESCGALRLLPCKVPDCVEAVGVGWTTIVDLEMLVRPQPTIRFYLRTDTSLEKEPWWWLPVSPDSRGWKLSRKAPPTTHQPSPHKPSGLLSALICSSCHATVLRQHWRGWTCSHCGLSVAARALSSDIDVDWGKMPILTEGPRMDNGRVLCIPPISRTDIKVWDDGIKVVDYNLPAVRSLSAGMSLRNASTGEAVEQRAANGSTSDVKLHHFLSCGDWRRTCDKLLQRLLDPDMPYERILGPNGRLSHYFSTTFFLTAHSTSHHVPFLPSPILNVQEHSTAADTLLDAVDEVESLLSRMNIELRDDGDSKGDGTGRAVTGLEGASPLMPFSTLTATVADVKDKLELLTLVAPPPNAGGEEPGTGNRQIAYLHLGSPAAMLISTTRRDPLASASAGASGRNRRTFQLLFSCMVAHGDVVLIRCGEGSENKVSVRAMSDDTRRKRAQRWN
ncbi:hypothetical protein BCV69DRAFT_111654 [Microstroma glucosiphilum]|uniref:Uncharacterized protein n=1 Tax=Pseudomicrostroma glucosiphilum TaxID=1684307 RepID=A0A316UD94_9BASI|nr:hypothetical protein BCV69DRAFT_111654 [Pseudomicrostroma glucosiphilum]PWN23190.1 hypothetical protein BCV69DRAFT_111654 [Pseudomicrostroma glucosiphilum]